MTSGRWPLLIPSANGALENSLGQRPRAEGRIPSEAVRGLIPAFEAKIHRTLSRLWGTNDNG